MEHKHFRAIGLADLHCGCPRLDPFHFRECVEKYVLPRITSDISHVFICGDFFDRLINMNSVASVVAMSIISELKKACYQSGTKLRVLRGTFTHDQNQVQHFLVTSPEYNSCVKLFDEMSIEYDEEVGMNFLYMPDNLKYADIETAVEELLESHGLKTVDVVIHHGYFKHMLPPGIQEPCGTLDYETFKRFYTGCVLNGHVHIKSIYNNVLSIGSFDRMAYGEEESKGFFEIDRTDGVYKFTFVENKDAQPFLTLGMKFYGDSACNVEKAVENFMEVWVPKLEDTERPVRIRVVCDDTNVVEAIKAVAQEHLKNVIVDRGATTKREQLIENIQLDLSELPEITPSNIDDLLMPIIDKQHPLIDHQEVVKVLEELKGTK